MISLKRMREKRIIKRQAYGRWLDEVYFYEKMVRENEESSAALAEQFVALTERSAALAEQAAALADKDAALSDKSAALAKQYASLAEHTAMLANKDTMIAHLKAGFKEFKKTRSQQKSVG